MIRPISEQSTICLNDTVITLSPYFLVKIDKLDEFKSRWKTAYNNFKYINNWSHYGLSFNKNIAHCREGYLTAESILEHFDDISNVLNKMITTDIATLIRIEIHGPNDEIEKLRTPLMSYNIKFFISQFGYRDYSIKQPCDTVISIATYFKIKEMSKFEEICKKNYPTTLSNIKIENIVNYGIYYNDNIGYCRESYINNDGVLLHLKESTLQLKQLVDNNIAELDRLEIHGPKEELDKIREKYDEKEFKYFNLEWGFRN